MHSHLIVKTFEGKDEAPKVFDSLQQMRGSALLGLENAAVVTKDNRGRFAIIQKKELPRSGASGDDLVSSAIALLFGAPPDHVVRALTKEGFDDRFRRQVVQAMDDGTSALLFLVARDSEVDRSQLRGILTLFKGRVFETTLPLGVESALAKGWQD